MRAAAVLLTPGNRPRSGAPWRLRRAVLLLGLISVLSVAAPARLEGVLIAEQACPATISIKRGDNPDGLELVAGERYRVVGTNRAQDPTHYRLRFEQSDPKERWVALECGRLLTEPAGEAPTRAPAQGVKAAQLVLAVTWHPAFCERQPGRDECRDQHPDRPEARRFSLHGLWPQPIDNSYCNVDERARRLSSTGQWHRLPAVELTEPTRARLSALMPGTQSDLHRHEWIKHGTCYGTDAETYYRHSIELLEQLNASAVQALFESHIGQRLRATRVQAAFDEAFGKGAGERVRMTCDGDLIQELRIGLRGDPSTTTALGELIQAAPKRAPDCRGGWVDRAGLEGPRAR
ncbi:MAG: ribonuclease T(2) [Sphingobacteriia bacterium]|nr:ribonuclease T(2) [Sphingobacteriia bacterium]NCC39666.1 ribonuclease T(2) [Gammaproteobacteria bacterium]